MTTITILPERGDRYRAVAGDKESTGRTAGEALDALTRQLGDAEDAALVILRARRADEFFNDSQQQRLAALLARRDAGHLSGEETRELEALVEAELDGARRRAAALFDPLKP
jgi:hypothetical protein